MQHGTVVTAEFISDSTTQNARSWWPRGLRRVSGAARLQGFGGSNPTGGMDACLVSVRYSLCDGLTTHPEESEWVCYVIVTVLCLNECVTSQWVCYVSVNVIWNPQRWGSLGLLRLSSDKKNTPNASVLLHVVLVSCSREVREPLDHLYWKRGWLCGELRFM